MSARWDPVETVETGPAAGTDDELLAVRAAEGDEGAFEMLVHRHTPAMLQLAQRLLGTRAEAEDAVQDSFVSAWRALPDFRREAGFATWLHRIVTNRCLNLLRARRAAADLDTVPEPAAPEYQSSPVRAAESQAAARDLRLAMRSLSAEQQVCWVLREIEGRPYEAIAQAVRISPEAVRARVFRARRVLTEAMAAWR
ncbi:sigma-70 family RNA polymerase sigma factor [Streptomyces sp. NPDC047014]|uniref:RNA polymerase sigma factor n=1 Tax=Streptomyces sp. NPDC047014 TaxID=3155736 RepID=UPI0034021726